MIKKQSRQVAREKRHYKLRNKIKGTPEKPRLTVFRSNNHMYAQLIDDTKGHTLVAASTVEKDIVSKIKNTSDVEAAKIIGESIAKKALSSGITKIVFDRSGYIYHGRVAALADAAREAGLQF